MHHAPKNFRPKLSRLISCSGIEAKAKFGAVRFLEHDVSVADIRGTSDVRNGLDIRVNVEIECPGGRRRSTTSDIRHFARGTRRGARPAAAMSWRHRLPGHHQGRRHCDVDRPIPDPADATCIRWRPAYRPRALLEQVHKLVGEQAASFVT